jgi:alpha,alpha-trehalose phosphorylase
VCKALWNDGLAVEAEAATGITPEEIAVFERAADAMYLPYDAERDIHAQDDSFLEKPIWDLSKTPKEKFPLLLHYHPMYLYRFQVCKQADTVLSHLLFEEGVDESTKRNSFEYYERLTTHDSSLSRCAFAIMAARLGMEEKAYDYFIDTLRTDLNDTHGNTKDGLHTANLGGSWSVIVMGFAGMHLNDKGLHFRFKQPAKWKRTSFRIRYLGRLLNIQMDNERAEVKLEEGEPVEIFIDGRQLLLD